ncbi:MAG: acetyltransferase GNAT family protein [Terrestrivirus sp.]|uniref:Acetyltransferase GNAT family protein n=1 Tax=Terrestrivirus sp. TaxID=2487775 RepID=A0A3G4ZNH2_9VIRU|nr:MAG: acetyltransferase GNAT family protein [Terrestrivirus sp.]
MLLKYKYNKNKNGSCKGYIQGSYETIGNRRRGMIHNLWVEEQFRNKKIGTHLLRKLVIKMFDMGIVHIELDDMSDNYRKVRNIYVKHGFKYKYETGPEMYGNTRQSMRYIKNE